MRKKNAKGQFVAKRFDTKISTIEKKYDVKLGVRSDMKLGTFLEQKGYKSLAKMLQEA
ncbi:MAG: hypothetical protein NTU76_03645 [Candidatus Taylorbacteria bacterium]|nr:hypothetical protein [Candidatus Taylorbacteria bacterium]